MTLVPAVLPGRPLRNGLPEFRPYVYRGTGYDQLTPFLGRDTDEPPVSRPSGRCKDCGYLVTADGHKLACGGAS